MSALNRPIVASAASTSETMRPLSCVRDRGPLPTAEIPALTWEPAVTEDGLSSPPFRRNMGIISGNRQFHTPDHPCTDKELARGCHEKCLEFYRRLAAGPPSADFLRAATDYKFPPP